jgi:4-hydroxy-tetrahydrodipicolinate synthase
MHGIHPAIVTPFRDGALDRAALRTLGERLLAGGVHGLVAAGTTGETPTLTADEWTTVVADTVALADGRIPVTAGIGTNATTTSVANAERARALGADAGLLVFPYYNKPNPEGHRAHVAAVLETGLPLVLYHVPGRTGQRLPASLVAELSAMPGVVAVKEATGDIAYGAELLQHTSTPVLSGDDFTFLGLLATGGHGCISVVANVAPQTTVAVYDAVVAGDLPAARAAMRRLFPVVQFLFSDTNPTPCKALLAAQGLCTPEVRLPLAPFGGRVPEAFVDLP